MRMDEIGYNHKHDSDFLIDRPNGAGDWLLLIIKTKAVFRIDNRDVAVTPHSVIIYTPDYPQYYHAANAEYIDDWIHFGPDENEEKLMKELRIPLNQIISMNDSTHISSVVKQMCYEQYSSNIYRKQEVDLLFLLLLYKLGECMENICKPHAISESPYHEKLIWLRESIYRWPSRNWSVEDMAAELNLSRSRLQHLYSDTFGISISKEIISSRMDKAADLLKKTNLPIAEISTSVGYGNISYFNRQFRTVFGKTPSQYRSDYWEAMHKSK